MPDESPRGDRSPELRIKLDRDGTTILAGGAFAIMCAVIVTFAVLAAIIFLAGRPLSTGITGGPGDHESFQAHT